MVGSKSKYLHIRALGYCCLWMDVGDICHATIRLLSLEINIQMYEPEAVQDSHLWGDVVSKVSPYLSNKASWDMQGWKCMQICIKKRTHHTRPVASRRARGARRSAQAKVSTSTSRSLRVTPSSLLQQKPFSNLGHPRSSPSQTSPQAWPCARLIIASISPSPKPASHHPTQRRLLPPRSLVVAQLGALVPKPSTPEPRTMAGTRKRALSKAEPEDAPSTKPPSLLQQIRNTWQFANLFQFIMLFGKALKMDDNFDIEDLEADCLKPGAPVLQDIGLGFLKYISSHRGLTYVSVPLTDP